MENNLIKREKQLKLTRKAQNRLFFSFVEKKKKLLKVFKLVNNEI